MLGIDERYKRYSHMEKAELVRACMIKDNEIEVLNNETERMFRTITQGDSMRIENDKLKITFGLSFWLSMLATFALICILCYGLFPVSHRAVGWQMYQTSGRQEWGKLIGRAGEIVAVEYWDFDRQKFVYLVNGKWQDTPPKGWWREVKK